MLHTTDILEELYDLPLNKSCCRKAFLCGLLYTAKKQPNKKQYTALFYRESDARLAVELIDTRFSGAVKTEIRPFARGGHKAYAIDISSKALCIAFADMDSGRSVSESIGFRCAECSAAFLRGVFASCAVLSDPKNGYSLELSVAEARRAELLEAVLSENVSPPSRAVRQNKTVLYYKSNIKISDLLYFIGAARSSFEFTNFSIERDIRNRENRATNCVTHNIMRAVDSNRRCIEAIEKLRASGRWSMLSDELVYTAGLRVENDSASLCELALLHDPPISKSGLNSRLKKLISEAEKLDK